MGSYRRHATVVTDANGDRTAYTDPVNGRISHCAYTKDGTTPYADGVDFTITSESTGQTIWTESNVNASKTISPLQPAHTAAGVAVTYDGTRPIYTGIVLAAERIKIVIASGGDSKTGLFTFSLQD